MPVEEQTMIKTKNWACVAVRDPETMRLWHHIKSQIVKVLEYQRDGFLVEGTPEQRELWRRTWRLAPIQAVKAYVVDARRLNDPNSDTYAVQGTQGNLGSSLN